MTAQLDIFSHAAVCALVASDPRNQPSVDAVTEAIHIIGQRDGTVDLNRVRLLLPPWVNPSTIGATFSGLRTRKVLTWHQERWTDNHDVKSRNAGKPAKIYEYNGDAS